MVLLAGLSTHQSPSFHSWLLSPPYFSKPLCLQWPLTWFVTLHHVTRSLTPLDTILLSLFLSPSPRIQAPEGQGLGLPYHDSQSMHSE